MFHTEELEMIGTFLGIQENLDDTLLKVTSKNSMSKWMIIDFSEKFKDRYEVSVYIQSARCYKPFKTCTSLTEVLKTISDAEYDY